MSDSTPDTVACAASRTAGDGEGVGGTCAEIAEEHQMSITSEPDVAGVQLEVSHRRRTVAPFLLRYRLSRCNGRHIADTNSRSLDESDPSAECLASSVPGGHRQPNFREHPRTPARRGREC